MKCEIDGECYFFQSLIPQQSRMGQIYRERYCEGDRDLCARYRVHMALGEDRVPQSLYPNMEEVADEIVGTRKP